MCWCVYIATATAAASGGTRLGKGVSRIKGVRANAGKLSTNQMIVLNYLLMKHLNNQHIRHLK